MNKSSIVAGSVAAAMSLVLAACSGSGNDGQPTAGPTALPQGTAGATATAIAPVPGGPTAAPTSAARAGTPPPTAPVTFEAALAQVQALFTNGVLGDVAVVSSALERLPEPSMDATLPAGTISGASAAFKQDFTLPQARVASPGVSSSQLSPTINYASLFGGGAFGPGRP